MNCSLFLDGMKRAYRVSYYDQIFKDQRSAETTRKKKKKIESRKEKEMQNKMDDEQWEG